MLLQAFINQFNNYIANEIPFLFIIDFELKKPLVFKLDEIDSKHILYNVNGRTNAPSVAIKNANTPLTLSKFPLSFNEYERKFNKVYHYLQYGDSYLTNLTASTEIELNQTLRDLFFHAQAKYKLLYKDQFLVFSPETFVRINNNRIYSYPMKGTIDASIPNASEIILNDQKELAEHVTIVDLIRNDLSFVSSHVSVEKFRYIERINTIHKDLLQVSSEIVGRLAQDYSLTLAETIVKILPAGSISGAPKRKTLEIIRQAEEDDRGYYTGVFGLFDGENLDSGVMIRYIEQKNGKYYYRSGGGITTQSSVQSEYQELIDKVYVPLN